MKGLRATRRKKPKIKHSKFDTPYIDVRTCTVQDIVNLVKAHRWDYEKSEWVLISPVEEISPDEAKERFGKK